MPDISVGVAGAPSQMFLLIATLLFIKAVKVTCPLPVFVTVIDCHVGGLGSVIILSGEELQVTEEPGGGLIV